MKYWLVKYRYKELYLDYWTHHNAAVRGSLVEFLYDLTEQFPGESVIDFAVEIEENEYNSKLWGD